MSTMRSWFFGPTTTHTPPPSSRSRKRARVGLSIDSDSSDGDGDELPDVPFRRTGTAQRERGMSDRISAKAASKSKAASTTWALEWSMTDSSDDDSIQRRRSMSEPHVYGDDSSSLEDEAPFLPPPSDLLRGGSGVSSPSPSLLPAPRRLRYPEIAVFQHNQNATHANNNHGRGTRRRTRTTEEHGRHEFWRSSSLDSDDELEVFVDTTTSISSSAPSSPTRSRSRGSRKFWTPYRLLMVLFLFATYTTFWLPIPVTPQATYSLRGSRISLDHATTTSTTTASATTSTISTTSNQSRPLPTLDGAHQRGGLMAGGGKGGSSTNNLILARPSGTASLAYRNSESMERFYQQEAFHHESDVFFRWSWYCNVVVLSMFVVAAAREYKNRGQAVCDL
jgi:hypothetical protein